VEDDLSESGHRFEEDLRSRGHTWKTGQVEEDLSNRGHRWKRTLVKKDLSDEDTG
jgi:hypothetical protein